MKHFFTSILLAAVLLPFVSGCADDTPQLIEGPVTDNGGFSPEELSGEGTDEETLGDY